LFVGPDLGSNTANDNGFTRIIEIEILRMLSLGVDMNLTVL